jgi:D-lactate dehydrogenase
MLEFMDGECVRLAREHMLSQSGDAGLPAAGALLLIEVDGEEAALAAATLAVQRAAQGDGCVGIDTAPDEAARERLWAARKALSPALRTIAPGKINEDVVVPPSRVPALVEAVEKIAAASALKIVCFGHVGNGNLHVNILYDPADAEESARARAALADVFDVVIALDGQLSGEHGIGLSKRDFLAKAIDSATLATMRAIKQVFDPDGILNPGKVLPPQQGQLLS